MNPFKITYSVEIPHIHAFVILHLTQSHQIEVTKGNSRKQNSICHKCFVAKSVCQILSYPDILVNRFMKYSSPGYIKIFQSTEKCNLKLRINWETLKTYSCSTRRPIHHINPRPPTRTGLCKVLPPLRWNPIQILPSYPEWLVMFQGSPWCSD